jgi:hypothetical protein
MNRGRPDRRPSPPGVTGSRSRADRGRPWVTCLYEGTNQIQRMVMARALLKG